MGKLLDGDRIAGSGGQGAAAPEIISAPVFGRGVGTLLQGGASAETPAVETDGATEERQLKRPSSLPDSYLYAADIALLLLAGIMVMASAPVTPAILGAAGACVALGAALSVWSLLRRKPFRIAMATGGLPRWVLGRDERQRQILVHLGEPVVVMKLNRNKIGDMAATPLWVDPVAAVSGSEMRQLAKEGADFTRDMEERSGQSPA